MGGIAAIAGQRSAEPVMGLHGLRPCLIVLGSVACASLPAAMWFQQAVPSRPLGWAVVAASALLAVLFGFAALKQATGAGRWLGGALWQVAGDRWWPPLAFGLLLRLAVDLAVPSAPSSDGSIYLGLAQGMAAGGPYFVSETHAYWPPGLSLLLMPLLKLTGSVPLALSVFGLGCFAVALAGTWRLGVTLGLGRATGVAAWLLALWPGHVLATGLPEKELLVLALLPWALAAAWHARTGAAAAALQAGALTGLLCYVQPSFQLLPVAALILGLVFSRHRLRLTVQVALAIAGLLLVLSPWTYRNWQVLSAPVLVSTNGGSNLYRANNELATGAFVARGTVDLEALPELEADRLGKKLAVQWITGHPLQFLQLSAGKVLLFLGDDSYGAYAAFQRGGVDIGRLPYLAVKLLCALAWWCGWAMIVMGAVRWRNGGRDAASAPTALLLLPVLYLLSIHAVFESGGKYHLPVLCPVLLLVAMAAGRLQQRPAPA